MRGLDGWSLMMLNDEKDFGLLYFENQTELPQISGLKKSASYIFQWFNPRNGEWKEAKTVWSDRKGNLILPPFPDGQNPASTDWAAKILEKH